MASVFLASAAALLLGIGAASAATTRARIGYNPGAQIDAAYLGSVPVGAFGHGGFVNDFNGQALPTGGPAGSFADRN